MASQWMKKAKCPNCCPDVSAAYFDATWDDEGKEIWECRNCWQTLPRRHNQSRGITKSQQYWIDRIKEDFGGSIEIEEKYRSVLIKARNEERRWFDGQSLIGSIGPRGKIKLTLFYLVGEDTTIKDRIAFDVYVKG